MRASSKASRWEPLLSDPNEGLLCRIQMRAFSAGSRAHLLSDPGESLFYRLQRRTSSVGSRWGPLLSDPDKSLFCPVFWKPSPQKRVDDMCPEHSQGNVQRLFATTQMIQYIDQSNVTILKLIFSVVFTPSNNRQDKASNLEWSIYCGSGH